MNTTLLKKIVISAQSQGSITETLELVAILIVMLKKFGKQLSQDNIINFLKKEYPDVYDLYILLGKSRCSLKQCTLLRQYLQYALGDSFIVAVSSHNSVIDKFSSIDSLTVQITGNTHNPMLLVQSPTKVYRRSLQDDLLKLV